MTKTQMETKMSKLNIELFKKIRERIATIPESYNQHYWCLQSPTAPCGTVACLAGEAIICDAPTVKEGIQRLRKLDENEEENVPDIAGELLGLEGNYSKEEGEHVIFLGGAKGWPEPYRSMFHDVGQAQAAVAYLDHIIKTGKVLE